MAPKLPLPLATLLEASDPDARERAWEALLAEYSKIILKASQNGATSRDQAMDRYAFVLEKLREQEFRRLKAFQADGRGRFTTWLFLVTRRLCVDHHRRTYGRRSEEPDASAPGPAVPGDRGARRRLADLLGEALDLAELPDPGAVDPETYTWRQERRSALEAALETLEPRDQLLVTLRFVDEVSVRTIARAMHYQSPFQVYRRLSKVLRQLKDEVENQGITGP